jgi:hypothetical protein
MEIDRDQIQKNWLFHLNAFLSKCDENYISGRALWRIWSYDTAGNLLWLSLEQLAKVISTQSQIEKPKFLSQKELSHLNANINNTEEFCKILSEVFRRINTNHSVEGLIKNSTPNLNLNKLLTENKSILDNINNLYQNRYYLPLNRSIDPEWIEDVDELYFEMRKLVSSEIPLATIDGILFDLEFIESFCEPFQTELFKENRHLVNRKYPELTRQLSSGRIVSFDGVNKTFIN